MKLQEQNLLRAQCYFNGQWSNGSDTQRISVLNPATGQPIGTVPSLVREDIELALQAAHAAGPGWRGLTAKERSRLLRRWHDLIVAHVDDLAAIMTAEQGKPLGEAREEVLYGAAYIEWYAEEAKRVYGDTIPAGQRNKRTIVLKEPVGLCAAITPWNFPSSMITRKAAPALAVGCPMVVKPASQTPYSALALAWLAEQAGIPPGVFSVVTGQSSMIGAEMTASPLVRKISFTGSTEVGKLLMRDAAASVKKVSMELGGHAPFIVFADADLDQAVRGAIASKYRNSGQTCICANRFIVQESIYKAFADKLTAAVRQLRVGNGFDAGVQQGPLIDQHAIARMEAQIKDAVDRGGQLTCGGKTLPGPGFFFEPTVLINARPDMRLAREETFGPLSPLFSFKEEQEAINLANNTPYGLAAYFYSRDINRVWRTAEALEYGIIGINTGRTSSESAPFGGIKESGVGREGSRYGLDEYLEIKYLCLGGLDRS